MTRRSTTGRAARRTARLAGGLALAVLVLAGCSSQIPAGTPPIPTFPGPGAAATTTPPPPRAGILPSDCNQILSSDTMPNLLGLPLGSVKVTALHDVPAPSAGRLERVTCNYTSLGGPGAPAGGTLLLKMLASGYSSPQAAQAQAKLNADVETQSGVTGQPVPLGAAQATYYDDSDGPLLVVVYNRVTASLTVGQGGPISQAQARPMLVDLAQRALPVLVPAGS